MSLRRFALIAPLTLKHTNKQNTSGATNPTSSIKMTTPINGHEQNSVTTTTTVDIKQTQLVNIITTTTTTATLSHSINKNNNNPRIINDKSTNNDDYDSYMDESSNNSTDDSTDGTYTNIINTYATGGGNGVQTIRASFGLSGLIGHSSVGGSGGGGGASISSGGSGHQTYPHGINGNANLLLCGAMLSVVTTILCVVCYCCHRNIKKRTEAAYRQQHQWLESDPNMEIYSVEQSYETPSNILGESSDGFTTLAMLHHEPPPSYDAVLAMQEQQLLQHQFYLLQQQQQHQQQQTHLQHNSPPPGYRSTIALNEMSTPAISASAATSNMAIDTLNNGSNSDLNGSCNISISGNSISGNSCNNFFAFSKPNAPTNRPNNNNTAFLNMKKALNAQSCCSLQRAEVENMWNAAAAAVAVRNSRATSSPCGTTTSLSLTNGNEAASSSNTRTNNTNNRAHISPMLLARKSLPLTLPAKFTTKTGGRRYLPHHSTYYRRGCPLCGKFRYDADDETLTLSVEGGLDAPTTSSASTVAAKVMKTSLARETAGGACKNSELESDDSCQKLTAMDEDQNSNAVLLHVQQEVRPKEITTDALVIDSGGTLEECACAVNILESSTTVVIDNDCKVYNNNSNNNNTMNESPISMNNTHNLSKEPQQWRNHNSNEYSAMMIDQNANVQMSAANGVTEEDSSSNCNINNALITESNKFREEPNANIVAPTALPEDTTLDALNANSGIIRVDMSKIIDQTGLPTYDAAAKLESSGYV